MPPSNSPVVRCRHGGGRQERGLERGRTRPRPPGNERPRQGLHSGPCDPAWAPTCRTTHPRMACRWQQHPAPLLPGPARPSFPSSSAVTDVHPTRGSKHRGGHLKSLMTQGAKLPSGCVGRWAHSLTHAIAAQTAPSCPMATAPRLSSELGKNANLGVPEEPRWTRAGH